MLRSGFALLFILASAMPLSAAPIEMPTDTALNIYPDSTPGWSPTPEQQDAVLDLARRYFTLIEEGRYLAAYEMHEDGYRSIVPFDSFRNGWTRFRENAGPTVVWTVKKVWWIKDSPRTPEPGVYAAIDFSARFANIEYFDGYLIAFQPPDGGDFTITRYEQSYVQP